MKTRNAGIRGSARNDGVQVIQGAAPRPFFIASDSGSAKRVHTLPQPRDERDL